MLRKAHERVAEHKLAHVDALAVMDAQHLGFPTPASTWWSRNTSSRRCRTRRRRSTSSRASCGRAARSSWSIISAPKQGCGALFEQGFAPLARRLGWRPEFAWARLAQWAERHGGVRLIERRADAAARAFLADPVRAPRGERDDARDGGRGRPPLRLMGRSAVALTPILGVSISRRLDRPRPPSVADVL